MFKHWILPLSTLFVFLTFSFFEDHSKGTEHTPHSKAPGLQKPCVITLYDDSSESEE